MIAKYKKIRNALNIAYKHIVDNKPDLVVLVDYVEFNLKIAKFAKNKNIPVLFYVAPQVWAWREKRIQKIINIVDHLAVVFPFEENIYHSNLANRKELRFGKKWADKNELLSDLFNSNKSLKKAIILKEVLDKPLALRK